MRFAVAAISPLLAVWAVAILSPAPPAAAADAYCPNPAHAAAAKAPANFVSALAKTFQIDGSAAADGSYIRCVGPKLMGCYIGANLDCDKADTRRTLRGATAWCRDNPGSQVIPMAATGHDTVYAWSCNGRRAIAGKLLMHVDSQGYIAENWKELP